MRLLVNPLRTSKLCLDRLQEGKDAREVEVLF